MMIKLVLVWMALCGIYPLAEPSHWELSILTFLDWGAHWLGWTVIWFMVLTWYEKNQDRTVGEVLLGRRKT